MRNFLFGPPGAGGFDLASLNIQRGRDHGLPDYNQARIDLGLAPVTSFADITSDLELQAALEATYGNVDDIDAWVGGLAEDHLPGASVGELVYTVLTDQFTRMRDGDRFWYQNVYSGEALDKLESISLSDVIMRNTGIEHIRDNVFQLDENYAPIADLKGAYEFGRYDSVRLDAGNSYDLEQSTNSLTYLWDFDNDGEFDDAVGKRPYFTQAELNGAASAVVRVKVYDSQGYYGGGKTVVYAADTAGLRISGDTNGVVGQMRRIKLAPAAAGPDSRFTYQINWGDGKPMRTVQGAAGATYGNIYNAAGTYRVTVTATDQMTGREMASRHTFSIGTMELQGDDFAISGTDNDDLFMLIGQADSSEVEVLFNGESQGIYDVPGRIHAFGMGGDDTFIGSWGGFGILFDGGDGDDTAYTHDGDDILYGKAGNDTLVSYGGDNYVNGGSGDDILRTNSGDDRIHAGDGNDDIRDVGGNNYIVAASGHNNIYTGTGNDWIIAGAGDDTITSRGGNNHIETGDGKNEVTTQSGNDTIYGGLHDDRIVTYGGKNVILSHGGDDSITAQGDGPNRVDAGEGDNIVSAELTDGPLSDDLLNLLALSVFS